MTSPASFWLYKETRRVPLPGFIADMLEQKLADAGPDDMLFGSSRGDVLRVRNMRRDWFDAVATETGLDGLTPHELRHTAASLAVQAELRTNLAASL